MVSKVHSWTIGPAESRSIRILLYLAIGLVPAYFILTIAKIIGTGGLSFRIILVGGLLAVVLVLIVIRAAFAVHVSPTYWVFTEFYQVAHPVWISVVTLIAIAVLTAFTKLVASIHISFFLLWIACISGAILLSSRGTIDLKNQTLTYVTIRQYEIPLESVTNTKRFTVGRREYLWLSFCTADRTFADRLVVIPVRVFDQIGFLEKFDESTGSEERSTEKPQREVLLAGSIIFSVLIGGFSIILYLGGGSLIASIRISVILFGIPFFLFLIIYFTNLFTPMSSK